MRKFTRFMSVMLLAAFLTIFGLSGFARAQQANAGSGLSISPVRSDLDINAGESKTITLHVRNVTSAKTEYKALINDFVADSSELGQPALILDDTKYAPSHSLKRYIAPVENVTVPAGQAVDVKVTINIPKSAAGGGYYGAVRFIPVSDAKGQNITLSASVGSLILVRVPGDLKENLVAKSFDVRKGKDAAVGNKFFTTNKDLYAVIRFENQGNIHEQPFGKVRLLKGDKVLQEVEINNSDPKGNVLPDSIRRFEVKLDKIGAFGKFTVEGNFGYGSNGQLISTKTTVWVLPMVLILSILVALIVIIGLIIGLPKVIDNYNKSVIRKAGRR